MKFLQLFPEKSHFFWSLFSAILKCHQCDVIHYFNCLKGTLDVVIGLEGGQDDIQEPAKQQNASTDVLESSVAAKLGSNVAVAEGRDKPSDEDEADSNAGADDIDRD